MSIESSDTENVVVSNESNFEIPVNSEVFNYLKNLLTSLKNSDDPIDVALNQGLHFFATGEYNENISDIINSLVTVAPHFIKFPVEDELLEVQQNFYNLSLSGNAEYGFPNVVGVIDCVHVLFQPEDDTDMELYLNQNSQYSINAQLVCGPDLQIYNVLAAFPGRFENLEIWRNSKLRKQLKHCCDNTCWLIGDEKYYQESNLMTPIVSPETEPHKLYNDTHTAVYKRIKYCLSMLKTRFKCLNSVLHFNRDVVCGIIIACCVLHNICICHNDLIEMNTTQIDSDLQIKRVEVSEDKIEVDQTYKLCDD